MLRFGLDWTMLKCSWWSIRNEFTLIKGENANGSHKYLHQNKSKWIQYKFYTHRFLSKCPVYFWCCMHVLFYVYEIYNALLPPKINKTLISIDWILRRCFWSISTFDFHHFYRHFSITLHPCFVHIANASNYKFDIILHLYMHVYVEWTDGDFNNIKEST